MIQIPEGFTPWFGETNNHPLSLDTKVEVQFRDGTTGIGTVDDYWWDRDLDAHVDYEIVAYRKV
jgi:hypothetical protein